MGDKHAGFTFTETNQQFGYVVAARQNFFRFCRNRADRITTRQVQLSPQQGSHGTLRHFKTNNLSIFRNERRRTATYDPKISLRVSIHPPTGVGPNSPPLVKKAKEHERRTT